MLSWEVVQRNGLQVKSIMLSSACPLDLLPLPLTLSKEVLSHRRLVHEKLCRAILDLADCVDGSPWLHRVMEL